MFHPEKGVRSWRNRAAPIFKEPCRGRKVTAIDLHRLLVKRLAASANRGRKATEWQIPLRGIIEMIIKALV